MKGKLTIALPSDLNPICLRLILRYVKDNDAQFLLKKDITIKSLDDFYGFINKNYEWFYEDKDYFTFWYHAVNFNIFCAEMIKKHKLEICFQEAIKHAYKYVEYGICAISYEKRQEMLEKIKKTENESFD